MVDGSCRRSSSHKDKADGKRENFIPGIARVSYLPQIAK